MSKKIVISLSEQRLVAYEGDQPVFDFNCVTGDKWNPTPVGQFRIFRKEHPYTSKKYGAKMDYAMFFSGGCAIHKYHGPLPICSLRVMKLWGTDAIGSHGCVRLDGADAKELWDWAPKGTKVIVEE